MTKSERFALVAETIADLKELLGEGTEVTLLYGDEDEHIPVGVIVAKQEVIDVIMGEGDDSEGTFH